MSHDALLRQIRIHESYIQRTPGAVDIISTYIDQCPTINDIPLNRFGQGLGNLYKSITELISAAPPLIVPIMVQVEWVDFHYPHYTPDLDSYYGDSLGEILHSSELLDISQPLVGMIVTNVLSHKLNVFDYKIETFFELHCTNKALVLTNGLVLLPGLEYSIRRLPLILEQLPQPNLRKRRLPNTYFPLKQQRE